MTETNGDPREGLQVLNFELPDHDLLLGYQDLVEEYDAAIRETTEQDSS